MNKLTINIDIDNVLNNLNQVWVQALNKQYSLNYQLSDIKQWDMQKTYTTLTKKQIFEPLLDDRLWRNLKPIKGSQQILNTLNNKYNVKIVTASYYKTIKVKAEWLKRYYPFLTWEQVVITKDKQSVKCDICVDDAIHNVTNADYIGLLFNYPWNESFNEAHYFNNYIYRVHNWQDIYDSIECINEERNGITYSV